MRFYVRSSRSLCEFLVTMMLLWPSSQSIIRPALTATRQCCGGLLPCRLTVQGPRSSGPFFLREMSALTLWRIARCRYGAQLHKRLARKGAGSPATRDNSVMATAVRFTHIRRAFTARFALRPIRRISTPTALAALLTLTVLSNSLIGNCPVVMPVARMQSAAVSSLPREAQA